MSDFQKNYDMLLQFTSNCRGQGANKRPGHLKNSVLPFCVVAIVDVFVWIPNSTLCAGSLDLFYIISYYINWAKTSWTYSMSIWHSLIIQKLSEYYTLHKFFDVKFCTCAFVNADTLYFIYPAAKATNKNLEASAWVNYSNSY